MSIEERRAAIARRDPAKVKAVDRARHERHGDQRRAATRARDRMKVEERTKAKREWARAHPAAVMVAWRRWVEANPEKRAAEVTAGNAIRDGRLKRQPCEVCGDVAEAHHDNYDEPLQVRWFCRRHHAQFHRRY